MKKFIFFLLICMVVVIGIARVDARDNDFTIIHCQVGDATSQTFAFIVTYNGPGTQDLIYSASGANWFSPTVSLGYFTTGEMKSFFYTLPFDATWANIAFSGLELPTRAIIEYVEVGGPICQVAPTILPPTYQPTGRFSVRK